MGRRDQTGILWRDRKRTLFGLPLSFTVYTLKADKLLVETGFWSKREEEVRLYRILDLTLRRTFCERLFGLGTIQCISADRSNPTFELKRIKHSQKVKDTLSNLVEEERDAKRVAAREYMSDEMDGDLREDGMP